MEIRLSRRSDYAIRAALHLARHAEHRRVKTREISEAMAIPEAFCNHIMAALVRAGLARSTAGPAGGYQLAADPATVSVLDLIWAVDGDIRASLCPLRGGPCYWQDRCALHDHWAAAQQAFLDRLARTDLATLADGDTALQQHADAAPEGQAAP